MSGRQFQCKITGKELLTPSVLRIVFEPNKKIFYDAGQFLSLVVPTQPKESRRLYSFASDIDTAHDQGYEICVKLQPNGIGSSYLKSLSIGDSFQASAPYGDFLFRPPKEGRSVCFIGRIGCISIFETSCKNDFGVLK
jgi:ferredoxin-NADP reductase